MQGNHRPFKSLQDQVSARETLTPAQKERRVLEILGRGVPQRHSDQIQLHAAAKEDMGCKGS